MFGPASALGALAGEEEFPPAHPDEAGEGKEEPARRSSDHVRSHVRLMSATAFSAARSNLAAAASSAACRADPQESSAVRGNPGHHQRSVINAARR